MGTGQRRSDAGAKHRTILPIQYTYYNSSRINGEPGQAQIPVKRRVRLPIPP